MKDIQEWCFTGTWEKPERPKGKYFIKMYKVREYWTWDLVCCNGVTLADGSYYLNRAQCRNVIKNIAEFCEIEWKEEK